MSPIATGDPSIDGIINWLTNGGSLQSPGAALGLGAFIKIVVIPLLSKAYEKWKIEFSGPTKLHAVFGAGAVTALIIGYFTKSQMTFGDTVVFGGQAALVAIGIHQTVETTKAATHAKKSAKPKSASVPVQET